MARLRLRQGTFSYRMTRCLNFVKKIARISYQVLKFTWLILLYFYLKNLEFENQLSEKRRLLSQEYIVFSYAMLIMIIPAQLIAVANQLFGRSIWLVIA